MPTLNSFINKIQQHGYMETGNPTIYSSQIMVVSKQGEFLPFNFKIKAHNALLRLPAYSSEGNTELIENNNPTIFEYFQDSSSNIIILKMNPVTRVIDCDGATDKVITGGIWQINNVFINGELTTDYSDSLGTDRESELRWEWRNKTNTNLRVKIEANTAQLYSGDQGWLENTNPTLLVDFATGVIEFCLSPAEQELPQISCDGATDNISLDTSFYNGYGPAGGSISIRDLPTNTELLYVPLYAGQSTAQALISAGISDFGLVASTPATYASNRALTLRNIGENNRRLEVTIMHDGSYQAQIELAILGIPDNNPTYTETGTGTNGAVNSVQFCLVPSTEVSG